MKSMKWWLAALSIAGSTLAAPAQDDPAKADQAKADEAAKAEAEAKRRAEEEKITEVPVKDIEEQIKRTRARIDNKVKSDLPALDRERKRRAVTDLARIPHPKTAEALKKIVAGKYEEPVRAAAALTLGFMKFDRKNVAKFLVGRIDKDWKHPEVLIGVANGLGNLQEAPDLDKMYRYFKHKDDPVYVSMIDCLGQIGKVEYLYKLEEIFSQYGKISTAGVNVRVDTGAAGTRDQQQAEARGRGGMKKARADRREGALVATQNAIERITGERFEYQDKFADWLRENLEELGLDRSKFKSKLRKTSTTKKKSSKD